MLMSKARTVFAVGTFAAAAVLAAPALANGTHPHLPALPSGVLTPSISSSQSAVDAARDAARAAADSAVQAQPRPVDRHSRATRSRRGE
jgi:hypothetical protein